MSEKQKRPVVTLDQLRDKPEGEGLRCPQCGCTHLKAIRTLNGPGKARRRERECRNCGHVVTTKEEVIDAN